ncbi:GNAT family N-acetyltransferase [Streptomyces sp. NPDC057746]|uniref:GNAT family N-acetyltransferase n=1 Tax=Streptomyces sp. NPDC057746 TaxID=3346237 RepID=UPI00368E1766
MSDLADLRLLMTGERMPELAQITDARKATPELRRQLIDCRIAVTHSGGAAGFPFPPVQDDDVAPAADKPLGPHHPQHSRLTTARFDDVLAASVVLNRDPYQLDGHCRTVNHLQTHPEFHGRGVGSALMRQLPKIARNELDLEQLHLAARQGEGLEDFYSRLGRREVGRSPCASHPTTPGTRS